MNRWKLWAFYAIDVVLVLLFAGLGRSTHHDAVFGAWGSQLWTTAWPFVVSLTAGWVVLRAWRRPRAIVHVGVGLWLCTVIIGLGLRWLSGGGLALPFVLVATGTLALLLIGWRVITHLACRTGAG